MVDPLPVARVEYLADPLTGFEPDTVPPAPLDLFRAWLADAAAAGIPEPNAATLATADEHGQPSVRMVLVKIVDSRGFRFFTNVDSRKGRELAVNPGAALLFGWHGIHRQVSVRGTVGRLMRPESEAYFATRPRGAQISAWASHQSQEVGRADLAAAVAAMEARFPSDQPVPMPEHWGGYLLVPEAVEFWVGRVSRRHDRVEYRRVAPGGLDDGAVWARRRLAP